MQLDRGTAMVEFALVAPLLFVVVFGMLDFGKAFNYWIDETQLAAQGARLAVVSGANTTVPGTCPADGSTPATLANYIQCQADTRELKDGGTSWVPTKARVCITPVSTGAVGTPVRVDVTTTYNWLPFISQRLGGATNVQLKGSATMRLEAAWTSGSVCST